LILNKIIVKNILIGILLIVLLIAVFMIRNRSAFGRNQTSFATPAGREITRIELSLEGYKILLEKIDEIWRVNGNYDARSSGISFILNVLEEMKIKSPVSPEFFSKEISDKNIQPVKVRVFEKKKLIRSFFVFRTGSNIYGNIMKVKPGAKPFIVYFPGFEGDLGPAFTVDELYWLPYMVFNLLPSEISSATLENFNDAGSSFKIDNNAGSITLSANDTVLTGWDTLRVRRYLSYFTMIPFESWATDLTGEEKSRITTGTPFCRITVTKPDGRIIELTMWEKFIGGSDTRDSNRLWARTGEKDELFVIRYFDIDPLLKKRSYFFAE